MSKLRVASFTLSLDGFGAGPDQDLDNPLGVGGTSLHGWAMATRTIQKNVFGRDGGAAGIDDDFEGINLPALGYACTRHESSPRATQVVLTRER